MIGVELAEALAAAGLRWTPKPGDAFVLAGRGMDEDVFYLADMTVEVHRFPAGPVIGFNGTVEWALDSVSLQEALWLPREDQLRDVLADRFVDLRRHRPGAGGQEFAVRFRTATGQVAQARGSTAAAAYAQAVLQSGQLAERGEPG